MQTRKLTAAILDAELVELLAKNGYDWVKDGRLMSRDVWPHTISLIGYRGGSITDIFPEGFLKAEVDFANGSKGVVTHLRRRSVFDASYEHEEYGYSHSGPDGNPVGTVKGTKYNRGNSSLKLSYPVSEQDKSDRIAAHVGSLGFFAVPHLLGIDDSDKTIKTALTFRLATSARMLHHYFGGDKNAKTSTDENLKYMTRDQESELLQIRITYSPELTDKVKRRYTVD